MKKKLLGSVANQSMELSGIAMTEAAAQIESGVMQGRNLVQLIKSCASLVDKALQLEALKQRAKEHHDESHQAQITAADLDG